MKDEELMLSVIMAVYETPKEYLKQAIDSILNQSYTKYEFIIIDDGCKNTETVGCLEEYNIQDNRIKLIRNSRNIGLTKSLNRALKECKGKYIARMDSDDISFPERFQKQIEYMENNPEVCLCGSNTVVFDGDNIIYDESEIRSRIRNNEISDIRMLIENVGFAHPTFMMRKAFLDEHEIWYDESLRYAQDYGLVTDIIIKGGKLHRIGESLLKYREHEGQISSSYQEKQANCQMSVSAKRIGNVFRELSKDDCDIIAELPYDNSRYKPSDYSNAIKKIFKLNREKPQYDVVIFEREFLYIWHKKVKHTSKKVGKPWGWFNYLSLLSIPSVISVQLEEWRLNE